MKTATKKRNIFAIMICAIVCAACAVLGAFGVKTNVNAEDSSNGNEKVFVMDDVASLRYNADKPGVRFRVKMDEQTKNEATAASATLGFVISLTNYVQTEKDGAGNYVNMPAKLDLNELIIAPEKIYEEEGYYYANAVVNTLEKNFKKSYTAVAYIKTGDSYTYADFSRVGGGIQSRTLQEVASKVYFTEPANHTELFASYATLGTEQLPILVSESGMNAYENLANIGDTAGKIFELTENIVVESKANVTLTGEYKAYTADEVYNTAAYKPAQDLYSAVNEKVDLSNIIGNLTAGNTAGALSLDYYVNNVKAENAAEYVFPKAGDYTVQAGYGKNKSAAVNVRVAETAYKEGLIFGGKGAELRTSLYGRDGNQNEIISGVTKSVTYNETQTFDSSSEGAYLFDIASDANTNVANAYFAVQSAWNKEYYNAVKSNYEYIVARMYIENTNKAANGGFAICETGVSAYVLNSDGTKRAYNANNGNLWAGQWGVPTEQWCELVMKRTEKEDTFDGDNLLLFSINAFGKGTQIKIWIDSVYFANEWDSIDEVTFNLGDKITEKFQVNEGVFSATRNGAEISVDENTVVENDSLYTLSRASKLRIGKQAKTFAFGQPALATGADANKFSAGNLYAYNGTTALVNSEGNAYGWSIENSTERLYEGSTSAVKLNLSQGNPGLQNYSDISIANGFKKEDLKTLQALGYEYITLRLNFGAYYAKIAVSQKKHGGYDNDGDLYNGTAASIVLNGEETGKFSFTKVSWETNVSNDSFYTGWKNVSFKIADVLNSAIGNYQDNVFTFRVFNATGGQMAARIYIDSVKVTKDGVIA